ncbi:MAG: right-handed parallel beta-helix repeat-containing protein [candidate division Zixibacteria bacterium]|nr:right-handed parallel beta-helix repeat-containing protein [candidate division Zixibacteria bacterium]
MRNYCLLLVLFLALAATVQSATIHVPAVQPTIQAGINAAVTGDTVLVADGTYAGDGNRDLDFGGRNIVLKSESGPELTVIDCGGTSGDPHRGLWFHSGENLTAVVEGFTITNGYAEDGGGISCVNSSPTISDNTVTNCRAVHYGAGIHCVYSASQIIGNTIVENTGSDIGGDGGGGISLIYCNNVLIADNTISGNFSYSGGGIDCFDSKASINHNTIEYNQAYGGAGIGLCCGSSGTIDGNVFIGNTFIDNGGAIICNSGSDPLISNNVILGNTGSSPFSYGGAICCLESEPEIVANVIAGNYAANGGGLAFRAVGSASVRNCTLYGNSSDNGGGVSCDGYATPLLLRCIIAFSDLGSAVHTDGMSIPSLACCDLYGNAGGDWTGSIAGQLGVDGNMSADPMFCDADNGDYHVSAFSPCAQGIQPNLELIGALPVGCDTVLCGDTDGDGELTEADLQLLYDFYFDIISDCPYPIGSADLDCDGMIRLNDIILLAGYIHGYGPAPCCDPAPKRPDQSGLEKNDSSPGF